MVTRGSPATLRRTTTSARMQRGEVDADDPIRPSQLGEVMPEQRQSNGGRTLTSFRHLVVTRVF
jgi:hypothetical protein